MSGPKNSDWVLSEDLEDKIEMNLFLELEKEIAYENLNYEINNLKESIEYKILTKRSQIQEFIDDFKSYGILENSFIDIEMKLKSIEEEYKELLDRIYEGNITYKEIQLRDLNDLKKSLESEFEEIEKLNEVIYKNIETEKTREFFQYINDTEITFEANHGKYSNELNKILREFNEIFNRYNNSKYILDKELLQLKKREVHNIIESKNLSLEYKIKQLSNFIKDIYAKEKSYKVEEEKNKEYIGEYRTKYVEYKILCGKLNIENEFKEVKFIREIKEELINIEKKIKTLKGNIVKKEKYVYAINSVNEVMEELGYHIISSEIMKKVNRNINDNIYNLHSNSALSVLTSDNGTIMFEVTAIDTESRKEELSSLEKLKVKEAMIDFCNGYKDIKIGLAKRGIYFENEKLKEANEKYARLRINKKSKDKRKSSNKRDINKKREYI